MPLLILADDLTGAADCAARCVACGLPATIALAGPPAAALPGALAFTSDSRHLPPGEAAQRVRELAGAFRHTGGVTWYKKIDSTLRGNLGSELDAILDALDRPRAVICPAFPAQGRGLRDGRLLADTAGIGDRHLPTLLAEQSQRTVAAIGLDDVRAGAEHLAGKLATARAELLVVDGISDSDLETILDAVERSLPRALLCGSAGLTGALAARQAAQHGRATEGQRIQPLLADGAALLVVGSGSQMAHRQVEHLRQRGAVHVAQPGTHSWEAVSGDLLLHLPPPPPHTALEGPHARTSAAALASAARQAITHMRPGLLVLVGGDTAIGLLGSLGVSQLDVLRELLPGMPLAYAVDAAGKAYHIILKAGNHGDPATLETLLQLARQGPIR